MSINKKGEVLASSIFDFLVFPIPAPLQLEPKGKNKKRLLVFLGGNPSPELHAFLGKILGAAGFDLASDALLFEVREEEGFSFAKLAETHCAKYALFFGTKPKQAMLSMKPPNYRPFTINGISFLFAGPLSAIQNDQQLKRLLWEALKAMFGK